VLKLPLTVRAEIEVRILVSIGHAHFALGALVDSAQTMQPRGTRPASWSQGGSDARVNLRDVSAGFIRPAEGVRHWMSRRNQRELQRSHAFGAHPNAGFRFRLVFDSWSEAQAELCKSALRNFAPSVSNRLHPISGSCMHIF